MVGISFLSLSFRVRLVGHIFSLLLTWCAVSELEGKFCKIHKIQICIRVDRYDKTTRKTMTSLTTANFLHFRCLRFSNLGTWDLKKKLFNFKINDYRFSRVFFTWKNKAYSNLPLIGLKKVAQLVEILYEEAILFLTTYLSFHGFFQAIQL